MPFEAPSAASTLDSTTSPEFTPAVRYVFTSAFMCGGYRLTMHWHKSLDSDSELSSWPFVSMISQYIPKTQNIPLLWCGHVCSAGATQSLKVLERVKQTVIDDCISPFWPRAENGKRVLYICHFHLKTSGP